MENFYHKQNELRPFVKCIMTQLNKHNNDFKMTDLYRWYMELINIHKIYCKTDNVSTCNNDIISFDKIINDSSDEKNNIEDRIIYIYNVITKTISPIIYGI